MEYQLYHIRGLSEWKYYFNQKYLLKHMVQAYLN